MNETKYGKIIRLTLSLSQASHADLSNSREYATKKFLGIEQKLMPNNPKNDLITPITFPMIGRSTDPQLSAAQCTIPERKSATKPAATETKHNLIHFKLQVFETFSFLI